MRHKLFDTSRACFLVEIAERVYGVDPMDTTRNQNNVNARTAISVILIKEEERYESIGEFFDKNHSSIHHAVKKHPQLMEYDRNYREHFNQFVAEIKKPINNEEYTINEIRGQVIGINNKLQSLKYNPDQIRNFWEEVLPEFTNELLK
jgi:hypothetical protein